MRFFRDRDTEHQLDLLLNKGLTFLNNVQGGLIELTTTGGIETIHHNLGYIPSGWIELYRTADVILYAEAPSTWTDEIIYLHSSAASVTVRLFVM